MAGNVVDYGFYLIQRGEAGHLRGCYQNEYKDSGGIETIGYGTVTRPGYNSLNFRETSVTEEQAIDLAKQEMAGKINEKCRTKFKDFDNLLPCYQAAILDTTYQGNWGAIQNAMNEHNMQEVYRAITNNPNHERAAVRGRAIEMGMLIEQAYQFNPNADPKEVAAMLAQVMIENHGHLNGTDCALTKDELALLYRSCMAMYGVEVTEQEIEQFAMSYTDVASGMCGIGSSQMAQPYSGLIPVGPSYDGSRYAYAANNAGGRGYHGSSARGSYGGYSGYGNYNYNPVPFRPTAMGEDTFEPDSKELAVSTRFPTCNYSGPRAKKQMIVLHTTESSSLNSTVSTFGNPGSKVSAHYTIDRDGKIFQHLPEGYTAWHAGASSYSPLGISGSCNAQSIGIEIQRSPGEPLTPEQIASTMALVKDIQKRQGISPEHTVAHSDVAPGRKTDPGADFPWEAFAREGLATMNHLGVGGVHAQHYNPELAQVRSSDCQYYNAATTSNPTQIALLSEEAEQPRADNREAQRLEEERREATRLAAEAEKQRAAMQAEEERRKAEEERQKEMAESSLIQTLTAAQEAGQAEIAARGETIVDATAEGTSGAEGEEGKSDSDSKSSGKKSKKSSSKKKSDKKDSDKSNKDEKETKEDKDEKETKEDRDEKETKEDKVSAPRKERSTLEASSGGKVDASDEAANAKKATKDESSR